MRILEVVADLLSDQYVWRKPITLEIQTCGETGARWDLTAAAVIVCYEFAQEFSFLYRAPIARRRPSRWPTRRRCKRRAISTPPPNRSGRAMTFVARVSAATCGASKTRISLRSSGLLCCRIGAATR
jgi:hypothetical protein